MATVAKDLFAVDSKVFVKSPAKSWLPGVITARNDKGLYTVLDEDKEELHKVHPDDLAPCREDLLSEGVDPLVHDLLFLTVLHDATLLRCLKVRYMKDIVYTNIGAIVVALNPFNYNIPWYANSEMEKYMAEGDVIRHNMPHSWAVAHNTYYEMINDKVNQTILVSGESGAGKTEACKIVLAYLGKVSMKRATPEQVNAADDIRKKIQSASPILEGFGNAKTVRNHNSSRFGKLISVKFHSLGYLAGAFTSNYLLEKSRIVTAAKNERVYHSFYHLTKGRDNAKYGVKRPTEYKSTFSGKCITREDSDDSADYDEVIEALVAVEFTPEQIDDVWRCVAGCLVAQDVVLSALDSDNTIVQPSTKPSLIAAAESWGISAENLEKEILSTTNELRGEVFVVQHRLSVACDMRDALCKHAYEKLFQTLVNKINKSTDCEGDFKGSTISVLDIFGFEDFDSGNSFEQLCINLANEALQDHYNNYIFKKDLEECRREGVDVEDMRAPDNGECLKLITDSSNGIMAYLDEECRLGTGSDDGFLQKVLQHCSTNRFFAFKPLERGTFIVKHYAGSVTYQVKGFLEKNRDSLKDDMKRLLRSSKYPLIAQLLPDPAESEGVAGAKKGPKTVGGLFKQQVQDMMTLINSTNPHWIRCVKPHPAKKPLMFDGVQVMNQLNSSGVLGTVKIRKAGYPVRLTFANFFARYKILIGKCSAQDSRPEIEKYVARAGKAASLGPKQIQCGQTRVFMKSEGFYELEKAKDEAGVKHRLLLQSAARAILSEIRARSIRWTTACLVIQEEFREYLRRTEQVRIARRIAREKMIAEHLQAQHRFEQEALQFMKAFASDEEETQRKLSKDFHAKKYWLEEKVIKDATVRSQFTSFEGTRRTEVFNEFLSGLHCFTEERNRLYVMALPETEAFRRNRVITDEMREFNILVQLFQHAGSAMFRIEIERNERRMRRMMNRLEDVQRMEMRQRYMFFKEFMDSLYRNARDHVRVLRLIKGRAIQVAMRAAHRVAVRDKKKEVDLFTHRHPHDTTKLGKELAQLSVGTVLPTQQEYTRMGDKIDRDAGFSGREAWKGVIGVPDIDQILKGAKYEKHSRALDAQRPAPTSAHSDTSAVAASSFTPARQRSAALAASPYDSLSRSRHKDATSLSNVSGSINLSSMLDNAVSTASPNATSIKSTHVFETFRDAIDEMSFLRMRHIVAAELAELAELSKYNGPYATETNITNKKKLFIAQEELQVASGKFCEVLVVVLRKLNTFCQSKGIPEQDVTGQWKTYTPVPTTMTQEFPPCTDWKGLLAEQRRLHYAVQNYKEELIKVMIGCATRGAKSIDVESFNGAEKTSVEVVHKKFLALKGYFDICSRCLYPMAPKATLVSLRLLWPKVQDSVFKDRCRDCMSGVAVADRFHEDLFDSGSPKSKKSRGASSSPRRAY